MPIPSTIVVTAVNDRYLPLAMGLFSSLISHMPAIGLFDIGVLDVGLSAENSEALTRMGLLVKKAKVDFEYSGRIAWEEKMPFARAMSARPFLPNYFPGHDLIAWMDSDTWLQTPDFLQYTLPLTAKEDKLFIVPEFDRDYQDFFNGQHIWQLYINGYRCVFDADIADQMLLRPMLNVGVFVLQKKSQIWKTWQDIYVPAMQRVAELTNYHFMTEQYAINIASYLHGAPTYRLPQEYNWLCSFGPPSLDTKNQRYVRPTVPHNPISVMHLVGNSKSGPQKIRTLDGVETEMLLTRPSY